MKILIAGSSGFIGQALTAHLRQAGHAVHRLVRRDAVAADEVSWNPEARTIATNAVAGFDALINLAGANVSSGRWNAQRRVLLRESRIDPTATLVEAVRRAERRPTVLVNASAVGWYGDRGEENLTEHSAPGDGFLAEVCRAWEGEANRARDLGVRVVCPRLGVVLGPGGGALAKMLPLFRLGLGGRLGSGRQWMSWIHRDDVVAIIAQALGDARFAGPLNVVAPSPARNQEFTAALARAVHRPAIVPAPRWALRAAFGQMADETLLASTRVVPAKLLEIGYAFRFATLDSALEQEGRGSGQRQIG